MKPCTGGSIIRISEYEHRLGLICPMMHLILRSYSKLTFSLIMIKSSSSGPLVKIMIIVSTGTRHLTIFGQHAGPETGTTLMITVYSADEQTFYDLPAPWLNAREP